MSVGRTTSCRTNTRGSNSDPTGVGAPRYNTSTHGATIADQRTANAAMAEPQRARKCGFATHYDCRLSGLGPEAVRSPSPESRAAGQGRSGRLDGRHDGAGFEFPFTNPLNGEFEPAPEFA